MAEELTREQKIATATEAMREASRNAGTHIPNAGLPLIQKMAAAAVDALDPPKRIELTRGFYAVPNENPSAWGIWCETRRLGGQKHDVRVGELTQAAVETWRYAVEKQAVDGY